MNCNCGHPAHHHAGGVRCHTVSVSGPKSPANVKADGSHRNRIVTVCACANYQAAT